MSASPSRLARRLRAEKLRTSFPPAAELLAFLAGLVEAQEPVYLEISQADWVADLDAAATPRLQWDRVPWSRLVRVSRSLAAGLEPVGPEPVRTACTAWKRMESADVERWLEHPDPDSAAIGFVAHCVRQVVAEVFADHLVDPPGESAAACAVCGGPPLVSILREGPPGRGVLALRDRMGVPPRAVSGMWV